MLYIQNKKKTVNDRASFTENNDSMDVFQLQYRLHYNNIYCVQSKIILKMPNITY